MAIINIMALRHSAFYAPLLMTIKGGYLEKQGLQAIYSLATSTNPIAKNLLAGTIDLAQSAPAVSFADLEQGKQTDIVHFAAINNRDGFYLTARKTAKKFQWSDLEGREVLVDHLFQPYATLRYAMFLKGADFDKIKIIDAGNVAQIDQAFRNGQASFAHQQGPAPQQLEYEGIGNIAIAIGDVIGPLAFSSLCATRQWLQSDMAQAFLYAYEQAMQDTIAMPSKRIANIIHEFLPDIEHSVLVKTLDDYKKLQTWQTDIRINRESYENLLKVFLHNGYISQAHAFESCIIIP